MLRWCAQELRHAAYGSVSAAAPVPKQRKKVMHSWQRSVPRPPMGAAVPQPPLRRSLAATSHAPVEASAQSPSIPHRSLIDAGLLHGASTRVSWAAGGAFARVGEHCTERSADGSCHHFPHANFCRFVHKQMAAELNCTGLVSWLPAVTYWVRRLQMGRWTA